MDDGVIVGVGVTEGVNVGSGVRDGEGVRLGDDVGVGGVCEMIISIAFASVSVMSTEAKGRGFSALGMKNFIAIYNTSNSTPRATSQNAMILDTLFFSVELVSFCVPVVFMSLCLIK